MAGTNIFCFMQLGKEREEVGREEGEMSFWP